MDNKLTSERYAQLWWEIWPEFGVRAMVRDLPKSGWAKGARR